MLAVNIEDAGMTVRARKGAFTLYTHLSWTGRLVLGEDGVGYSPDALDLCPELDLGLMGILLDAEFGMVVNARADHGDRRYLAPEPGQCLLLATASPVEFTPKALEAIASAMIGGDEVMKLPEVQSANARHFIARLHQMGIGDPPAHIL